MTQEFILFIASLLVGWTSPQLPSSCVTFSSPKVVRDQTVVFPLQPGLQLRILKFGVNGWRIEVGPIDDVRKDYLWAVSPPYRTAPHRQIGPGYGLDARQSATLTPRQFKYVLKDSDYDKAIALASRAESGDIDLAGLDALGKGVLTLRITAFGVDEQADAPFEGGVLEWVAISGEACVPK